MHGQALKVKLKAPPVDGKANAALIAFVARCLGVGRRQVEIVSGQTSRIKTVRVEGLAPGDVVELLGV